MSTRENTYGGPTILDINTGFIRDSNGVENLFTRDNDIYSSDDFNHYGRIIKKLKDIVSSTFKLDIDNLYFTAPTFITRLDGNSSWSPLEIHDEYWHIHADMSNTPHYHYSGLLYMSNYDIDFTGGRFIFTSSSSDLDEKYIQHVIEPRIGRVVMFTSGEENLHRVERLTSGERYVLSFWFTCDEDRQFEIFLDGKKHTTFSHRIRQNQQQKRKQTTKQKDL